MLPLHYHCSAVGIQLDTFYQPTSPRGSGKAHFLGLSFANYQHHMTTSPQVQQDGLFCSSVRLQFYLSIHLPKPGVAKKMH